MTGIELHVHPMVVHFPIALFVCALVFEVLSLAFKNESYHRTALNLYVLAAIVAPLVVWTGLEEAKKVHLVSHPVFNVHKSFALATMSFSLLSLLVLWVFKRKINRSFRLILLICLLSAVSLVSIAAYNGGRLVYDYGIGIEDEK